MLDPRWRKVVRDLWLHRSRTLLVVLAIAVGIIGAGSVLNTWALLRRVTREGYLATNPASATLRVDSVDAALLARVRELPAVREAQARRTVFGAVMAQGTWLTAELFVLDDFSKVPIGRLAPTAGAWPPPEDALVVEHSSLDFAGLSLGDTVRLRLGDAESRPFPVVGIARDAGLAPGWMEHVVYGFITRATLARLGGPASLDQLQLVVRDHTLDRDAIRRIAFQVKAVAESAGYLVSNVEVPVPGRHIHAAQMDSLLYTQGAFGLLALLLSGFLVINLITAMLAGQVREIGVMKALGARPDQLAAMYLVVALSLGIVACLLAVPLAALIGRGYAKFAADLLNFDLTGFGIPRRAILAQLGVGALLPVAAAALPVLRGCRISVSDALRDVGLTGARATSGWSGLAGLRWLSRPLLLSLRNAFRRRQRMALTLLTLAMGGAVFLGALNLRAGIRNTVGNLYGKVLRFDLTLRFRDPRPAAELEAAVAALPGVAAVEAWGGTQAAVAKPDGTLGNSLGLTGLPVGSRLVAFAVEQGRWLAPSDANPLVVSRRVLDDEPGLTVGSEVTLLLRGRTSRWSVVGVVEAGPAGQAYTTRAALALVLGDSLVRSVVVKAEPRGAAAQTGLIQELRSRLADQGMTVESSTLLAAARSALEDHLLMVAGFLSVMAQLMIVVGGLGLASTMSLAVLERTREIGVLRAIGARHRSILALIQGEGLVISLLSWLLAIPLSLPMSWVLGQAFGRVMLRVSVPPLPQLAAVLEWLLVVLVVSLAACAWPALRATRIPTAAALAYE